MNGASLYNTSVSELLSEGKYLLANRFLKRKNIHNINEVNTEVIIEFCDSEGAGIKKVEDFLSVLTEVYITKISRGNLSYDIKEINFWFAQKQFKRFREYARDIGIKYVEELDESIMLIIPAVKGLNKKKVEMICKRVDEYKLIRDKILTTNEKENIVEAKSPKRILFSLENLHNSERIKEVIYRRYANGETLESIGDKYGISRERVRQLQVIGIEEVVDYLNARRFTKSLKNYYNGEKYCTLKDFYSLFNDKNKHYATLILNSYNGIFNFKELDLIYFEENEDIKRKVNDILRRLPRQFFIYDYLDYLIISLGELGLSNINTDTVKQLLSINEYYLYGEYVSSYRLSANEILEIILEYYHKPPIKFNEDGFDTIKKLSMRHLEYKLNGNVRAFENRLRENQDILLVDKLTFQHIKNSRVKDDIIIRIGEIIEENFKTQEVINASQIYNQHMGYFIVNGIETKYKMYNLISIYFGDYYKVGRGNTLEIYKNQDILAQSKEEILIDFLAKFGGMISKDIIIHSLGWASYKLEDTISKSKNLIKLGDEITTLQYLEITDDENEELRRVVDGLLELSGFTTGLLIFDKVKNNKKLNRLIGRGNINRSDKISSVVKKLFNDIRGHINFVYNKTSAYKNIEEVLCGIITGCVKKEKLKEYMLSLGYKDMMISMTINKIIDNEAFYEISREELVATKSFDLNYGVIKNVIDFIEERVNEKGYVILSNIEDYQQLPIIEFEWNHYLLKSIACRNGYRSIQRVYSDIRGEKIIIAKEDSKIQSYDELLLDLLSDEYEGLMIESKIYDFFSEVGVVKKHRDLVDKKIPYDLKISGKIKIDEVGIVSIVR